MQGCCIHQDILFPTLGRNHLFAVVYFSVGKCLHHSTVEAFAFPVLVYLEALTAKELSEILCEFSVGFDNIQITVLDGYVTWDLLKQHAVAFLAFPYLLLQALELSDVGGHLQNRADLPVFIPYRGRIDYDRHLATIHAGDALFPTMILTIVKGTFHRADFAFF